MTLKIDPDKIDLSRGHKRYVALVSNLKGILEKLREIFDVSEYEKELREIDNDVNNCPDFSKDMIYEDLQLFYEGAVFTPFCDRVEKLTKKVEDELVPFYELYLLTKVINNMLVDVNEANIFEIIKNAKRLLDTINSLNTHNKKEYNDLVMDAYKTIYNVILHEELFERNDVLRYLNQLNVAANRESIGRLLGNDIKRIDKNDIIKEDLRTIEKEGLGYDYLNESFVKKVAISVLGEIDANFKEKKSKAISSLNSRVSDLQKENDSLRERIKENLKGILNLRFNTAFLGLRLLSVVLVPIITISAGYSIGKRAANKNLEYSTITRTVNPDTGEVVGDVEEIYDSKETTYTATIKVYSPWRKSPSGIGYVSDVIAYELVLPENADENYHATKEDLEGHVLEKYRYVEPKNVLSFSDSVTESLVLITETYQDKDDNRPNNAYTVGLTIAGIFAGLIIDLFLAWLDVFGFNIAKEKFAEFNAEIKDKKLSNEQIKTRLLEMHEEISVLKNDYNDAVKRYGTIGDEFIIDSNNSFKELKLLLKK